MVEKSIQEQRINEVLYAIAEMNIELSYEVKDRHIFLQQQLWSDIDTFVETIYGAEISINHYQTMIIKKDSLIFKQHLPPEIDVEKLRIFMTEIINEKKSKSIYAISNRIKSKFIDPPRHFNPEPFAFKINCKSKHIPDRERIITDHLAQIITAFSLINDNLKSDKRDSISESIFYQLNQYIQTGDIKTEKPEKLNTKKISKPMIYISDEGTDLIWRYSKFCPYCLKKSDDCYCESARYDRPDKDDIYTDFPCHKCNKELIKRAFTQKYNSMYKEANCKAALYDLDGFIDEMRPSCYKCTEKQAKVKIQSFNKKYGKWFKGELQIEKYENKIFYSCIVKTKKTTEADFEKLWEQIVEFYAEGDYESPDGVCSCPNW